jgi:hypothetical protein
MAETVELTDEHKEFIVQGLACYDSPSQVVAAVKEEFGIVITRQRVQGYDPTKVAGKDLSEEYRTLFANTRAEYDDEKAKIGATSRLVRVRRLERMAQKAEASGNIMGAAQLLKQIAEEMGNAYTNRRELTGKDGKDLPAPIAQVTTFQLPANGRDEPASQ